MIISPHNAKIQWVRALLTRRKDRQEAGAFVAEGVRLVEEALQTGWMPEWVLYSDELSQRGLAVVEGFQQRGVPVEMAPHALMQSLSETEASQGLLAVLPMRELPLPLPLNFVVIADRLRDPGNLGTLLRTAAAAGAQAVLLPPETADPYAPKVVRSGMGAHFRLPVRALDWAQIGALCAPLQVLLAESGQGTSCWQTDLRQPLALVVGAEADGVSPAARELATGAVTIPMPGQSESLNAAIAAAILLFEVVRQRKA